MISSELVNVMFSSFAKFVSKLTGREVKFEQIKHGEVMSGASLKIEKFLKDATVAFDDDLMKMIGAFEPGKIYCLQVDFSSGGNFDGLENVLKFLVEKGVDVVIIDSNMNFVSLPDGYEVVKVK